MPAMAHLRMEGRLRRRFFLTLLEARAETVANAIEPYFGRLDYKSIHSSSRQMLQKTILVLHQKSFWRPN